MQLQQQRHKSSSLIFVAVQDLNLIVSVKTRMRSKALGFEGMQFKWNRDRQQWRGPLSLRNLEAIDSWPGVELSTEAKEALDDFRAAARRRREYYGRR